MRDLLFVVAAFEGGGRGVQGSLDLKCGCVLQELVRQMVQKESSLRLTAEEYLIQQKGKAFPEYFYTFLKLYLQRYATSPILSPDDRVARCVTMLYHSFTMGSFDTVSPDDYISPSTSIHSSNSIYRDKLLVLYCHLTTGSLGTYPLRTRFLGIFFLGNRPSQSKHSMNMFPSPGYFHMFLTISRGTCYIII